MEEKILQTKKNGMVMLLLTLLGYVVFTVLFVYSLILLDTSLFPGILLMALSILYWVAGIFPVLRPEGAQAAGSTGAHPLRRLHRHLKGAGLLLGESVLHRSQPCSGHKAQPER